MGLNFMGSRNSHGTWQEEGSQARRPLRQMLQRVRTQYELCLTECRCVKKLADSMNAFVLCA